MQVALVKRGGRFVTPAGTLTRRPVALVARSTRSWSLRLARKLPAGRYRVVARAFDARGNQGVARTRLRVR